MTTPDLVLLQTQRLTDNPNGGGQMTNTIIPDNQANNLFGPISRVNRADGNVSCARRSQGLVGRYEDVFRRSHHHCRAAEQSRRDRFDVLHEQLDGRAVATPWNSSSRTWCRARRHAYGHTASK
jgi:hypothetical protein